MSRPPGVSFQTVATGVQSYVATAGLVCTRESDGASMTAGLSPQHGSQLCYALFQNCLKAKQFSADRWRCVGRLQASAGERFPTGRVGRWEKLEDTDPLEKIARDATE